MSCATIGRMSSMRPFLLLQLRSEDEASDNEYEAFRTYGGLAPEELVRVRIERDGVPSIDLKDYAGVIVGGGPYNVSDPVEKKSGEQQRAERGLLTLLDTVVEQDTPFFGACYGIGILAVHEKSGVSKKCYGEPVGGVTIRVTDAGASDPLLRGLPREFRALCGHKEACQVTPASAVLLARSDACPVQMLRIKQNIYATQFHPELDHAGLEVRVNIYKHHGYFPPEEAQHLIELARDEHITVPMQILRRFVERYRG